MEVQAAYTSQLRQEWQQTGKHNTGEKCKAAGQLPFKPRSTYFQKSKSVRMWYDFYFPYPFSHAYIIFVN